MNVSTHDDPRRLFVLDVKVAEHRLGEDKLDVSALSMSDEIAHQSGIRRDIEVLSDGEDEEEKPFSLLAQLDLCAPWTIAFCLGFGNLFEGRLFRVDPFLLGVVQAVLVQVDGGV